MISVANRSIVALVTPATRFANRLLSTAEISAGQKGVTPTDTGSPSVSLQNVADVLPFIACPLTKAPLRYDTALNQLVCDELGVAYPVVDGVPQLVPLMGQVLPDNQESQQQQTPRS